MIVNDNQVNSDHTPEGWAPFVVSEENMVMRLFAVTAGSR